MNKRLEELSFDELSKEFLITTGLEARTYSNTTVFVPYKEIMVVKYEMPEFDFNTMPADFSDVPVVKPRKVGMRIRIYDEEAVSE